MIIRQYKNEDCDIMSQLFYETVHSINARDYSPEQLSVWANNLGSLKERRNDLLAQRTLIAEIDGVIVGFGSIEKSGYLDLLFVHREYQKQGVATALCDELEKGLSHIITFASITAKPFFENRGYVVKNERETERFGVKLKNFQMQKDNSI